MIFNTNYRLEKYILESNWEDFPDDVRQRTVVCAIDLFMALLLGSKGRQHRIGIMLAREIYRDGNVPVIGSRDTLSFMGAAVAMAHAANSFDIDDGHNMIRGHPGASFIGGVLAAALERGIKYRDFLTTLVVSYEVTIRWALAMQDYYGFMHSTGAYGAFGTAVGVGRVFGLSEEILNNALSIADFHAPMTPVMRAVEYPSMNKDGVPFGTTTGAMAILEASMGYQGRTHLLEMPEYEHFLSTLGLKYEIMNLYFKPFTCCRWAHQPIAAVLSLMNERRFTLDELEKVVVHTFEAAAKLSKKVPLTTDEAQYNIAFPVAAAIVHGDLGYMQVRDEALGDSKVSDVMKRLEFVVDSDIESQFPGKRLARVEITLRDGSLLKSKLFTAPGEASDNVGLEWISEKFKRITSPILSDAKQDAILCMLSGAEDITVNSVADLINTN
jgi:2-methylcitrate dehydratase PrpD